MSYDRGPLQTFEITWMSGHAETIQGHQVSWPHNGHALTDLFGGVDTKADVARHVHFHGEFDGKWTLVLSAREDDIRTIRNVTAGEPLPGGDS